MAFNNLQWIPIGFALALASKLAIASSEAAIYHHTTEYRDSLDSTTIVLSLLGRKSSPNTFRFIYYLNKY